MNFATSNERILQRVTSDFLQRETSATSNEQSLQQVTSDFLERATSTTSNEWILQRVTSNGWKVTPWLWLMANIYKYKYYEVGYGGLALQKK